MEQAVALLGWLQGRYPPGKKLKFSDVDNAYSDLVAEKGWNGRPWGGRKGIGEYFAKLPGVRKISPYWEDEDGERLRGYQLPQAQVAADVVELPTGKRA